MIAVLAVVLRAGVPTIQITVMLVAVFLYNKIPFLVPIWDYNHYLDFYGGYHDRVNYVTIQRLQELVVYLFIGIGLRGMMDIRQRQNMEKE